MSSELYQVANYGLAGHYYSHYDQVVILLVKKNMIIRIISLHIAHTPCPQVLMEGGKGNPQHRDMFNMYAGDRLATVMAYLSDVPMGGYTVFPFVGAFVKPQKVRYNDKIEDQ